MSPFLRARTLRHFQFVTVMMMLMFESVVVCASLFPSFHSYLFLLPFSLSLSLSPPLCLPVLLRQSDGRHSVSQSVSESVDRSVGVLGDEDVEEIESGRTELLSVLYWCGVIGG